MSGGHIAVETGSNSQMHSTPVVSVAITSYNSEVWIARAIESALAQRTDFAFEILVGDDSSEDGTVAVAESYRAQYPDKVQVFARETNVGTQRNYYELFERCRGKYVAWLDADDYWTDPEKLALQVKTLEDDASIMICGHFVRWVSNGGEVIRDRFPTIKAGRHGMADILGKNFLPSPSVVFRKGLHRNLPEWYFDVSPLTDWPLYVVAALSGDIYLLDRSMADYTLTQSGSFWGKGDLFWYEVNADFYERVESILPARLHQLVRRHKGKQYEEMAYLLRKDGRFSESRKAAVKAFCSPPLLDNLSSKTKALLASLIREAEWRVRGAQPV
jgi:glycosyltransferase involved in cell wall biosynthesis